MKRLEKIVNKSISPLLIFVFSVFGTWLLLYNGLNIGDDYYYHLPAILDKYLNNSFEISSSLANGLGYGSGLFYSPLSHLCVYLLAKILGVFGISLMTSYKLVMLLSVFTSGIFMYSFAMKFTKGNKVASLVCATCLVIYPYRLFNMFCRLAIAEAFAFTFIPLFLCGLYEITHLDKARLTPFIKTILGASLLYLSHNLTALFVFIFGIFYLILYIPRLIPKFKELKFSIFCVASVLLIIGLCASTLFTQLELLSTDIYAVSDSSTMRTDFEHLSTHIGKEWYYSGFLNINFLAGLGYSNSSLYTGILLFVLGCFAFILLDTVLSKIPVLKIAHYFISSIVLFGISCIAYFRLETLLACFIFLALYIFAGIYQEKEQGTPLYKNVLLWICVLGIPFVLYVMSSSEFWKNAPDFLLTIQFPWRLWSLVQIFVSILVGILCSHFATKKAALCVVLVFVALIFVLSMPLIEKRSEGSDEWQQSITQDYLDNISALGHHKEYAPVIFTQSDYTPQYSASLYYDVKRVLYNWAENDLNAVILSGSGQVLSTSGTAPNLEVSIALSSDSIIQLPLLYYPGYKAVLINENGEKTKLDGQNIDGLVSFEIKSGTYTLTTDYVGTPLRNFGKVLTAISATAIILAVLYDKLLYKFIPKNSKVRA